MPVRPLGKGNPRRQALSEKPEDPKFRTSRAEKTRTRRRHPGERTTESYDDQERPGELRQGIGKTEPESDDAQEVQVPPNSSRRPFPKEQSSGTEIVDNGNGPKLPGDKKDRTLRCSERNRAHQDVLQLLHLERLDRHEPGQTDQGSESKH